MQLSASVTPSIIFANDDFIVAYKRAGFRTHKVSDTQWGFVETLSALIQTELFVVHRLDKDTSGLIVFAKNKEAAAELALQFEKHAVQKTYYFLTNKKYVLTNNHKSIRVKTHIEKNDKTYCNNQSKPANAETDLVLVKEINQQFFLWQANPITGKPHQIRLHAEHLGISVLGDTEHGGDNWFRLALHAQKISFDFKEQHYEFTCDLPYCFENKVEHLGEFVANEYADLVKIISILPEQTYRLYHRSNYEKNLRIDLYGNIVWVYWYKTSAPTQEDLSTLNQFCQKYNFKYVVRHMLNRGAGVGGKAEQDLYYIDAPEKWTAKESNLNAELRRDQGFSPGLFLDQRANRKYVQESSKNKTVLNLFSYTSLFSVAAAVGEASTVTTVDASPTFLNWSRENFKINNLNDTNYEFYAQDSLLFLKGSVKRNRKWDIIICDPPSFGRTKTTTWKIEKDFPELLKLMWSCLNKKGYILFTCNYEKWTLEDIKKQIQKNLPHNTYDFKALPIADLDFEFPDSYDNLLKGLIIQSR